MSTLDEILSPFKEQFSWSGNDESKDTLKNALKKSPFYLARIRTDKWGLPSYPFYTLLRFVSNLLDLGHMLTRGPIDFIGYIFEAAEKSVEGYRVLLPLKLLFYLLKQPFKWAATAITATFQIADSVLALVYATSCAVSSLVLPGPTAPSARRELTKKGKAEAATWAYFSNSIDTLKMAVPRLILTGLIGVAGYFLGPLGVAAFAGTIGTVGAGLAVAGIGTVGATAVQAAVVTINDRCSRKGDSSTALTLGSLNKPTPGGASPGTEEIITRQQLEQQQQRQRQHQQQQQQHQQPVKDPSHAGHQSKPGGKRT